MCGRTIGLIFGICGLLVLAPVYAQDTYAPPRNVDDILAVLDQYKPDPKRIEQNRAKAREEPAANLTEPLGNK